MAIPRQKFRELVLLLLYSRDLSGMSEEELDLLVMDTLKVTKKGVKEAGVRVAAILEQIALLDKQIEEVSFGYALDRIQKTERNILRLALFEMLHDEEVPEKVAICEAMRLAKKFSTEEAAFFVNALLDNVYKKKRGEILDKEAVMTSEKQLIFSEEVATRAAIDDHA